MAPLRTQLGAVRATLEQRLHDRRDDLLARFQTWPPTTAAQPASLDDLQQHLAEISYLRTLLGDVEETLGDPRGPDRRH